MKKLSILAQKIRTNPKKFLPAVILCVAIIISGVITLIVSPKPQQATEMTQQTGQKTQAMVTSDHILKPSITPVAQDVLGANTDNDSSPQSITVTPAPHQTASQATTQNSNSPTNTPTQSTTVASQQSQTTNPTATPVPTAQPAPTTAANTVSMQIQDPAGTSTFTVTLNSGANACDILQEAKSEGKINSVTFDDSYMSTLHSRYVTEINGYQKNWTFTVNGSSPNGCSLSNPKPNDSIIWKFN